MVDEIPEHLRLYDETYFSGNRAVSGYDEYANCLGVMRAWSLMVWNIFRPTSLLDVGAAYGYVPQFMQERGIPAIGVDPSPYALSRKVIPEVYPGALPDFVLPDPAATYDVVTCTECLEHLPPDLVPASLAKLTQHTAGTLVCLIMLDGPGADGDPGHICLRSAAWWNEQFDQTGLRRDQQSEDWLNTEPYCQHMKWSGRFFVRRR